MSPTGWISSRVRWDADFQGWGSHLGKAEGLRSLCIHKLLLGFMTRAAAEPVLSVHYHSSIVLCVYGGYSVGEIYPAHCRYSELFPLQQRDVRPFQSSVLRHQEMAHPDAGLNPEDSSSALILQSLLSSSSFPQQHLWPLLIEITPIC